MDRHVSVDMDIYRQNIVCLPVYMHTQTESETDIFYQISTKYFEEETDFQKYLWALGYHEVFTNSLFTLAITR